MENHTSLDTTEIPVRERLLTAALACFLADDYHHVSTRLIAEKANTTIAMIRYYFGNKEGLYEEMIRETLHPLLEVLDSPMLTSPQDFSDFLQLYYQAMQQKPEFPKLIIKVLALNQGPGKRFIQQLLERGRTQGMRKIDVFKAKGQIDGNIDPDLLRLVFVSLAMTLMLLKDIFEQQLERKMDDDFLKQLAMFNGKLLAQGLLANNKEGN